MSQDTSSHAAAPADTVRVAFEPVGRRGPCQRGMHLLACAQTLGVDLAAVCGGRGTCGRCRVVLTGGTLSPLTSVEHSLLSTEDITRGVRLACQAVPLTDCELHVPEDSLGSTQRIQVEGLQSAPRTDPPVVDHKVTVAPADLHDVRGDADRVQAALNETGATCDTVDIEAARALSRALRAGEWTIQASVRGRELVGVGRWPSPTYGLAVDLGTTKLAGYLLDLSTGATLAARGAMNPQIRFGEDVVTRLSHALAAEGGDSELSAAALGAVNELVEGLCSDADADPERILEAVVVGNTAMHHLMLRLPVDQLARAPYVPSVRDALDVKARELGINIGRGAWVHFPPNIAGFVGSDHVAALLATGAGSAQVSVLIIDIGTNTEVCLAVDGRLTTASCASGPAFEGGHIRDGMRAASGAIEHVQIDGEEVRLQVVDHTEPIGICGSGILDALAEMTTHRVVDSRGRLNREHPRVQDGARAPEFVLVSKEQRGGKPALSVTQGDIRQLQLAKSAIATGIQSLLEHAGITPEALSSVIVAGAFGTYIDIGSAIAVGMLPDIPSDRFRQVGNAAGAGAKMALASRSHREEARELARKAGYLELATSPTFMQRFVNNTALTRFTMRGG
jgi:uncharacterized 2Fe-2S/4Fe-4S cluster protein (DUF4445 family)